MRKLALAATLAVMMPAGNSVAARSGDDAGATLERTKTLKCALDIGTGANWKSVNASDEPKLEPAKEGKAGTFVLDAIDMKKGTARLIGDSEIIGEGASDIGNAYRTYVHPSYARNCRRHYRLQLPPSARQ